jgi:beta-glucosidase
MRTAAKNILYVVANSRQYDPANLNTGMAKWKVIMYVADAIVALLLGGLLIKFLRNYRKRKAGEMV